MEVRSGRDAAGALRQRVELVRIRRRLKRCSRRRWHAGRVVGLERRRTARAAHRRRRRRRSQREMPRAAARCSPELASTATSATSMTPLERTCHPRTTTPWSVTSVTAPKPTLDNRRSVAAEPSDCSKAAEIQNVRTERRRKPPADRALSASRRPSVRAVVRHVVDAAASGSSDPHNIERPSSQ